MHHGHALSKARAKLREIVHIVEVMPVNQHAADIIADSGCVAIDCGAARGLLPHWRNLLGSASLYLFEPDDSAHSGIHANLAKYGYREGAQPAVSVIGTALSKTGGPRTLHVPKAHTGASLYEMNLDVALEYTDRDELLPMTDVSIETSTLASVLDARGVSRVDMMKLDTQGAELEIMQGLDPSRMRGVVSVELEIAMHRATVGQPTFSDVSSFLESNDMEIFDIVPKRAHLHLAGRGVYHRSVFHTYPNAPTVAPRLWEVDVVYFKRHDVLLAERSSDGVRRLCLAYCVYGYFAHAHRLLGLAKEADVLSAMDCERLQGSVVQWHARLHRMAAPMNVVERVAHKLADRVADLANPPPSATRNNY